MSYPDAVHRHPDGDVVGRLAQISLQLVLQPSQFILQLKEGYRSKSLWRKGDFEYLERGGEQFLGGAINRLTNGWTK